jgi:membrane-associated phospholipid phosphatase
MKYEALLRKVYSTPRLVGALKVLDLLCSALVVIAFLLGTHVAFFVSVRLGVGYMLTCGIPFVLVSVVRRLVAAPRPYELLSFSENRPRGRGCDSFPSRHAFSAFVIGGTLCYFGLPLGLVTLFFALVISACRILLGIHFLRDILSGATIGIVSALIGILVFL